jgi:hypothetical protein
MNELKQKATIRLESGRVRIDVDIELRHRASVFPHLTIDLEPVTVFTELSISMLGYEKRGKRWVESVAGQGRDYVLEHFGVDARVQKLCAFWARWHLNGLHAGTREQEKVLRDQAAEIEKRCRAIQASYLTVAEAVLAEHDLNPSDGYRYGSAWLVEVPPENGWVQELQALVEELGGSLRVEAA